MLDAIHTGHDNSSIAKFLKVGKSWVWRVRKEFEDSEDDYEAISERSTHKQRSSCARTPEFVPKVQEMIDIGPGNSIRLIAHDLGRSESMIKNCVLRT